MKSTWKGGDLPTTRGCEGSSRARASAADVHQGRRCFPTFYEDFGDGRVSPSLEGMLLRLPHRCMRTRTVLLARDHFGVDSWGKHRDAEASSWQMKVKAHCWRLASSRPGSTRRSSCPLCPSSPGPPDAASTHRIAPKYFLPVKLPCGDEQIHYYQLLRDAGRTETIQAAGACATLLTEGVDYPTEHRDVPMGVGACPVASIAGALASLATISPVQATSFSDDNELAGRRPPENRLHQPLSRPLAISHTYWSSEQAISTSISRFSRRSATEPIPEAAASPGLALR